MPGKTCVFVVIAILTATVAEGADAEPPTVRVGGVGKVSAAPDLAELSIGVTSQAPTAQAALAKNNADMTALVAAIKTKGVAEKDIQTSQIQVNPEYSNPPATPVANYVQKVIGYRVTNTVQVKVRQINVLGPLLDSVVQAGANQIYGINFRIAEPEKFLDEARSKAVADAKRKAHQLADDAGIKLGAIRQILEGELSFPIHTPMPYAARGMMMASAPQMPIAAGEQELSVSLTISFGILP